MSRWRSAYRWATRLEQAAEPTTAAEDLAIATASSGIGGALPQPLGIARAYPQKHIPDRSPSLESIAGAVSRHF